MLCCNLVLDGDGGVVAWTPAVRRRRTGGMLAGHHQGGMPAHFVSQHKPIGFTHAVR